MTDTMILPSGRTSTAAGRQPVVSPEVLRLIRDHVIYEVFGGTATYELLRSRNPQIDLILNAGIVAGIDAGMNCVDER